MVASIRMMAAIFKVSTIFTLGYFNMNDKDKTGVYFNALENKKFMFVFDKGKKISERSVKEIEDSNQVDDVGLPKLLKKDTEKVEEI